MNKNTSSTVAAVWLLLLAPLATTHADAQTVPALINYQGKLVNSNGLPVSTGDYQLRFRIYDTVTNGNLIWGPQVFNGQTGPGYGPLVSVVQGWFNVILGPVDINDAPIANAFAATNRYVEIQLGTNTPFYPRQQILSAPYALVAGSVPDGSITTSKIAVGAIGLVQLAPGIVRSRQRGTNIAKGDIAISAVESRSAKAGDSEVELTSLRMALHCSGQPALIVVTGDGSGAAGLYAERKGQAVEGMILLRRNGAIIGAMRLYNQMSPVAWAGNQGSQVGWPNGTGLQIVLPGSWTFCDADPPAGINQYSFHIGQPWDSESGVVARNLRMVVFEPQLMIRAASPA